MSSASLSSELETTIRRLLDDETVEDFAANAEFRQKVLNRPEAASVLVDLAVSDNGRLQRAASMLCLFDRTAVKPLAASLSRPDPLWRSRVLNLIWTLAHAAEFWEGPAILEDIRGFLVPLLSDQSVVSPDYPYPPEILRDYRVCDEAYVLWRNLSYRQYDDSLFIGMASDERDVEISTLRTQVDGVA